MIAIGLAERASNDEIPGRKRIHERLLIVRR
jgi:hypothetical protein